MLEKGSTLYIYIYQGECLYQPGVVKKTVVQFVNALPPGNTGLIYRRKCTDTNQKY